MFWEVGWGVGWCGTGSSLVWANFQTGIHHRHHWSFVLEQRDAVAVAPDVQTLGAVTVVAPVERPSLEERGARGGAGGGGGAGGAMVSPISTAISAMASSTAR